MWAAIVAILPFLQQILNWWNNRQAQQSAAGAAEAGAETQHQDDGAQSVADRDSADQQNTALNQVANQLDNPTPVVVVVPTKDKA